MSLFLRPSSSSKIIPNTFLRKKRKWPHSPYKTKWHYLFAQQQAMLNLKTLASSPPQMPPKPEESETQTVSKIPYLLSCLITSFKTYDCEPTPSAYHFLVRTLIRNAQFAEISSVLSHLEKVEKFETPEPFFVHLIRVYGRNGMFQEAIDVFFGIPGFRCAPTACSLNALLSILCRNRDYVQIVPEILLKSHGMGIRVDESSFFILIKALCRIGKIGDAIKLLRQIVDDGFLPDGKVYSVVLSSLCKAEGVAWSEILGFFEEIKRDGHCPTRIDFINVINYLVRQGKGMEALNILGEMKAEGIKPDIICYTIALRGVIEDGEFERAEDLFDELLVFGLIPDVNTYNVYINGLCKKGDIEAGYKMIRLMEQLGCWPDSITYNTILDAFHRSGQLNRTRDVFMEMKLKERPLDLQTYSVMLNVYVSGGDIVEVHALLDEMLTKSFVPLSSTIDEMICGMYQGGFVSESLHMLEKVIGCDVAPGLKGWGALVSSLKLDLTCQNDASMY